MSPSTCWRVGVNDVGRRRRRIGGKNAWHNSWDTPNLCVFETIIRVPSHLGIRILLLQCRGVAVHSRFSVPEGKKQKRREKLARGVAAEERLHLCTIDLIGPNTDNKHREWTNQPNNNNEPQGGTSEPRVEKEGTTTLTL